jgi:nitroimidazol reductase NimA-like FMN-containing flavoprotein (pyridoxamine 5'-phosphate oxidase superfamily)
MIDTRRLRHGAGGRLADLTAYDCWALLESEEVARIAWNGREGVAIVPVNYTVGAGALWCRTSPDTALARECGGQRIVIEVDHLEAATRSGWSVVVSGVGELVDAAEVPEMLADPHVWPAVTRSLFVRVEPVDVTGRKLLAAADVG